MRQPNARRVIGCCVLLAACTGSERSGEGPWHEPSSAITVSVSPAIDSAVVLDTVRSLPAPQIRFTALVEPDPSHVTPATAPAAGSVVFVLPVGDVLPGDTVAVIGQDTDSTGRLLAVRATRAGTWRPRRDPRQLVWEGDTVGVTESHDFWWAVGSISDLESETIHIDDSAWVGTSTDEHTYRPGRVEWIRRTRFTADLAVEFRGHEPYARGTPVTAIVAPAHPQDSVPAVPGSAIVHFPEGPAVFSRVRTGLYQLRWVGTGEHQHGLVAIRGDVRRGTLVVAHGLAPLADAARDSLAARAGR